MLCNINSCFIFKLKLPLALPVIVEGVRITTIQAIGLTAVAALIGAGGLGNPVAAVLGGLLLGVIESLSVAFLSSTYKDAVALVVLLAVLFIRPQGLLGKRFKEKV